MFRVLFVCSGNTCRSPMAEMILRHLLEAKGLAEKIAVQSAGVHALDSDDMSVNAKRVLEKYAVNISVFSAKRLDKSIVEKNDLILCVTKEHVVAVNTFFSEFMEKTYLLGGFAGCGSGVADPFGLDDKEYEECFLQLKLLIEKALPKIISLTKEKG